MIASSSRTRPVRLLSALPALLAFGCNSSDSAAPTGTDGGEDVEVGPVDAALDGADASDGGLCHGDQTAWAMLTAGPIACTKNSDCCVIVNGCYSQTQVVAAANKDEAKAAWPTCDDRCNACIPPPTEVGCNNGACTGKVVDFADAAPGLMQDHCGVDGPVILVGGLHFGCGG